MFGVATRDGGNPLYMEIEKNEDGKYYIGDEEIPDPPGVYVEFSGLTKIYLDNEGVSFTDEYSNTYTGWTFTGEITSGYCTDYGNGNYGLYTGTTDSCSFYSTAFSVVELNKKEERKIAINARRTNEYYLYEEFDTSLSHYGIDKSGWWLEYSYSEYSPYAGQYKPTGEFRTIWISRYTSKTAVILERVSDGSKLYGVDNYNEGSSMEAYRYKESTSSSNPTSSVGQLRDFTVATYKPSFDEIIPGVAYDKVNKDVRYNPPFPPLWFEGEAGGGGVSEMNIVLEVRTFEECKLNNNLLSKYFMALYSGDVCLFDFNVKINGNYCRYRDCNDSEGRISFKTGRESYYYVNIDGNERTVTFGYYSRGLN